MLKDIEEQYVQKLKNSNLKKYMTQQSSDQLKKKVTTFEKPKHEGLVEEIRSLADIHPGIKQLNGVKGVFIKETFMFSTMFSWNTSNVFEIYEADSNGNILNENSNPILYSVAKLNTDCGCSSFGTSEMAITTKLDDQSSNDPFLLLKEDRKCCGYNPCQIFINDNGNSNQVGTIDVSCSETLALSNNYVNNLILEKPSCSCNCTRAYYDLSDSDGNRGVFTYESNCCSCSNPVSYSVGFPPNYNQDQNSFILSMAILLGFLKYKSRNKK